MNAEYQRLTPQNSLLIVVDIQERLLPAIAEHERVLERASRMVQAAHMLAVPALFTEQYPKGLGHTVPALRDLAPDAPLYEKTSFSCLGSNEIVDAVAATGARHLVLVGIETHVCMAQTALQALGRHASVQVVADATGSRFPQDQAAGLDRMRQAGVVLPTSEMTIFEWLGDASDPRFKDVRKLLV